MENHANPNYAISMRIAPVFFLFALSMLLSVPAAAQQKYPSRPVNVILGYPAGGTTDMSLRPLTIAAGRILGQPLPVFNKPGGGSVVAVASLKNEKPDGYTIGVLTTGGTLSQYMRSVPYDSAKDFTPIMQYVTHLYGLVVRSDSPWKTFKEFIEYAKANPGKIRYSTAGLGTPMHLVMERLAIMEKIKWTHIPFQGGPQGIAALLGDHVEAYTGPTDWKPQVLSGRLRGLALYAEKRAAGLPQMPTLLEQGYDIVAPGAISLIGPKGMSPEIVETLHQAFKKALEDPDYVRVCQESEQVITYRSPQELARYIADTHKSWGPLITSLGLKQD